MEKIQQMVFDFHKKYGSHIEPKPTLATAELRELRYRLICDEFAELMTACNTGNLIEVADSIGDLIYVVYGMAVALGIDMEPVMEEIQKSNMTKTPGNRDTGGKVVKGPDFVPPNLAPIIQFQIDKCSLGYVR